MDRTLIKLMRPYITRLVRKDVSTRYHSDIMRYLRPDTDNDGYIIVESDKGFFDDERYIWVKDFREERIAAEDVEPCIKVRFITPEYKTIFEVTDFGFVKFDTYDNRTVVKRVIADDCGSDDLSACHFHFEGDFCWHICEFAERVNPNGNRVRPVIADMTSQ